MFMVWAILAMITAVVFNTVFTMHPSDTYYHIHHDWMSIIAGLMGIPAWFIAGYVNKRITRN